MIAGPSVSVVVPTLDRGPLVLRLLEALSAQELPAPFEVVIVDDASRDDVAGMLRALDPVPAFRLVVLTSSRTTGPAGARNRGIAAATGEFIAFTDDDCVPDPQWLANLTQGLADADVAIGRTRPPDDQRPRIGPFSTYLDIGHDRSFSTCNIAYRRTALEKVGGFNEAAFPWPNGEDTDLGLRVVGEGGRDTYVPDALVWHDVSPSDFVEHFRRLRRLDGIVALLALHPEVRQQLGGGWFLRSVDKAVFLSWGAAAAVAVAPRRRATRLLLGLSLLVYLWQFRRSHYAPRSPREWLTAVPLGYVADTRAVLVLLRSSLRHRTVLL
jgi:GT2 family glycosyltransferase